MDPNIDKYVQQPNMPQQPAGGLPPQPTQPLMQTEQLPASDSMQQMPPLQSTQQPMQQPNAPQQPMQQPVNQTQGGTEHQGGLKSFLKVLIVLIIIIGATAGVVYAGYMFLGSKQAPQTNQNANVFVEPTQPPATPTPSGYQPNPNDASDSALDQDTGALSKDLDSLDTSITGVDASLGDKQTNLQ